MTEQGKEFTKTIEVSVTRWNKRFAVQREKASAIRGSKRGSMPLGWPFLNRVQYFRVTIYCNL